MTKLIYHTTINIEFMKSNADVKVLQGCDFIK